MIIKTEPRNLENFVYLHNQEQSSMVPELEYKAIYSLLEQIGETPENFYESENRGRIKIKENHISYISVFGIGLKILPESLGNLNKLENFNLGLNHLETIPESLGNCKKLGWVFLWGNPLNEKSVNFIEELKRKGVKVIY